MFLISKKIKLFSYSIPLVTFFWFALAVAGALAEILRGMDSINNYLIFKNVFWHSLHLQNLYATYPTEYFDTNHYGPSFSLLIAPFAILPTYIGCFLWCLANAAILFYAVKQLPISNNNKTIVLFIGVIEMMTSIQNVQFNPMLTAWIMLSYTLVQKEKDFWATFFIAAGFLIKLYGIVGIAFFWFSNHKTKFVVSFIFWVAVLFCLPIIFSSPNFIIQSYKNWYFSLAEKDAKNSLAQANNFMQDISVMGMFRRVFKIQHLNNLIILLPAALVYALPFLRFNLIKNKIFQLSYLALALIGVVIFSTSAESATYVLAMLGVAIWFVVKPTPKSWHKAVLAFALLFTSLSATDLFPAFIRINLIRPYSLKALPCFIVWIALAYELLTQDFSKQHE